MSTSSTASIIIFPVEIVFYSTEPYKTFDICNVHQYPVRFEIRATDPGKYLITTTEGVVNSHCKVTIGITHTDISVINEDVRERLRIHFSQLRNKKYEPLGYRDVFTVLRSGQNPATLQSGDRSAHQHSTPSSLSKTGVSASHFPSPRKQSHHSPTEDASDHNLLVYLLPMVVGVLALWLPTQGVVADAPWYLELSVATKITIAFFLGILVTLFYIRVQQTDR